MIRTLITLLAILGMVIQPIALARTAELQGSGMTWDMDSAGHMEQSKMADDMPCHDSDAQPSEDCLDCCDADCIMMEVCMTHTVQAPLITFTRSIVYDDHSRSRFTSFNGDRVRKGPPGFIDHPPKRS